ncbi:hypothetical protein COO60DRAFT_490139 [Scenedesmus sp. NREL 46B-D3]|nr:hypothetical protein COO60DRAFT_490139 [Scenedesmus sp. NREL 46B-D3]
MNELNVLAGQQGEQQGQGQLATPNWGVMQDYQGQFSLLRDFIQAASARSIVAGVQATLLLDLASELCRHSSGTGGEAAASNAVRASKKEPCYAAGHPASSPVADKQPAGPVADDMAPATACQTQQLQRQQQQHQSSTSVLPTVGPSAGPTSSSSEVTCLTMLPQQPLLHIAPLDLHINSAAAPPAAAATVSPAAPPGRQR